MAKAAKKTAAKPAAKVAAKPAVKAKSEKKTALKKEAPAKKEAKKPTPEVEIHDEVEVEEVVVVAKPTKKEKAAKAAADKALSEELKKWSDFRERFGAQKAPAYSMSATYEALTPLQHKVLGWGYILSVQNDRLEVLFESGPKMLISNYKPG